jgi:hypothetical protein
MMCFTYFYYCECIIKIFGLRKYYFLDGWCRFDFFLVCTSIADQFFSDLLMMYLPVPPTILRVMRVARVLRVLRLLKGLKGLRDLVMTLVFAFPGLMNVGALLLLVMFMFAVFGMNVFTYVAHGDAISDERNFESFGGAMLLLFQCITGDGWSEIMDDALIDERRGCDPNAVPSDCGSAISVPYFIAFTIIGTFVMLNLVVAVILENFTSLGNVNPDLVSTNDIVEYKEVWGYYDPDADGMIPAKSLPSLVMDLPPPLGVKGTKLDSQTKAFRFCLSLGLTQKNGEVAFKQVLDALIQRNYGDKKVKLADGDAPDAVKEVLLKRQQTVSQVDVSALIANPGKVQGALTPRRFEMSKILAEELLRMFIRKKREDWDAKGGRPARSAPSGGPPKKLGTPPPAKKAPPAAPPPSAAPTAPKPKGPAPAAATTGGKAAKGPPPKGTPPKKK